MIFLLVPAAFIVTRGYSRPLTVISPRRMLVLLEQAWMYRKSIICSFIQFTEIIFVDHQTGSNVYFKRRADQPITAALNYGNAAGTYGLWDGFGTNNAYSYQLLICDHPFYSGFLVSGYTGSCYKHCDHWCADYFLISAASQYVCTKGYGFLGHLCLK